MATPQLITVGKMAADMGVPIHRVEYVIKARRIKVSALAGKYRLFDRAAVALVAEALKMLAKKEGA